MSEYLSRVRFQIVKFNYRNRLARKLKLKGKVGISFTIRFPNIIEDLKVIKSSGYDALDNSGLRTIESIDNMPNLPKKLEINTLPITTSILYQ
jgi:TonB family protein